MKLINILISCLLLPLYAVDVSTPITLSNPTHTANEAFGSATAISDKYYAITSPGAEVDSEATGIIHIYDATTQEAAHTLVAPDAKPNDLVGASLAITGNYLIAGLPEANEEQGKVVVWDLETGNVYHTYTHPEPQNGDRFGHDVAINGIRVLVGVPKDDPSTTNDLTTDSGSAYLFDLSTKQFLQSFPTSDASREDGYGTSVALTEKHIIIGSPSYDTPTGEGNEGAVYVYSQTSYELEHVLTIENAEAMSSFGFDVAAQDNILVASAYRGFSDKNVCYLFDLESGKLTATLNKPSSAASTYGYRVAIGDVIAIGDHFSEAKGKVYLYDMDGGGLKTVTAPLARSGDQFATDLAMRDDKLLVGAKGVDVTGSTIVFNAGAGYLYSVTIPIPLKMIIADNQINLRWSSDLGVEYKVLMSKSLASDSWEVLNPTAITGTGGESVYTVSKVVAGKRAFFMITEI